MLPLGTKVRIITEEFPHGIGLKGEVVGHYSPEPDKTYNTVQITNSITRVGFRTDELEVVDD